MKFEQVFFFYSIFKIWKNSDFERIIAIASFVF